MARPGINSTVGPEPATGSAETRRRLVEGAIEALAEEGFSGASAREIARRAGCTQGLVFYHFGSVANLLLAALDEVSARRRDRYQAAVEAADGLGALAAVARSVFEEDLDTGHMAVLAEMIAGASFTPGLGAEVSARIDPWRQFVATVVRQATAGTPLAGLVPADEVAHGIVALYLGLEMLAHLDGDRTRGLALFDQAQGLAALLSVLTSNPATGPNPATSPNPATKETP